MNNLREKRRLFSPKSQEIRGSKFIYFGIIILLSLLISAPLFLITYRYFPSLIWDVGIPIHIDAILCFSIIFFIIITILRFLPKRIMLGIAGSFLVTISILQLFDQYSFSQAKNKYIELIHYVENNPIELPFLPETKMTIRNAEKIKEAIDFDNPEIRDFAVKASIQYFNDGQMYQKYGNMLRYFSIFKTINKWSYVPDPKEFDYFSKASVSYKMMAGDCDDHAILMAACIKAIGGSVRLIHTKKHLYPEVNVGKVKDLTLIHEAIKRQLFYKESLGYKLFYHIDKEDNIWLNFDYTGHYPGAKFMDQKIIGILNI